MNKIIFAGASLMLIGSVMAGINSQKDKRSLEHYPFIYVSENAVT